MSVSPAAVQRDEEQRALWARTAEVAGRLNRAQGELVDLAVELIEGQHWGDGGFRSPEHYFVVRAGLSPAHARDVVAIAKRRHELTAASEALRDGLLSLDQTAVVAHHAPASHQQSAAEFAQHATVPQLRRALSRHAFAEAPPTDAQSAERAAADTAPTDPSPTDTAPAAGLPGQDESERRACARPDLAMHYDVDGRFQLRFSAPAPVGALVEQAIKEAKDALFLAASNAPEDGPAPQREDGPVGQAVDGASPHQSAVSRVRGLAATDRPSYADALEELARRSLSSVASTGRASHYRVYLHLSTDGAWVNGGGAIPQRLLDRFVSDGVLQPVWETEGRPVSVGRAMRILPPRSRRLIEDRDRGCRFPGCTATRFVEIHHLHGWADGGATDDDNQVSLCPFHHDAIGRGDYRMSGDPTRPDGLVVTTRHGLPVRPPCPAELVAPPGGDPPPPPHAPAYQPPTGERARWHDIEILHDEAAQRTLTLVTSLGRHGEGPSGDDPPWPARDADDELVLSSLGPRRG
ncbi:DUF222 domain-containing protein [Pedococcus bigeumensis]|uniref:HNH endonuclease signature motif containing protein n=1 Tax=Pedococcus bigeumensis TaxID=433644 RepID=UPI002FECFF1C